MSRTLKNNRSIKTTKCIDSIFQRMENGTIEKIHGITMRMTKDDLKVVLNQVKREARNYLLKNKGNSLAQALDHAAETVKENLKLNKENVDKQVKQDIIAYAENKRLAKANNYDPKKVISIYGSGREHIGEGVRYGNFDTSNKSFYSQLTNVKGAIVPELEKLKYAEGKNAIHYLGDSKNQRNVVDQVLKDEFKDDYSGKVARVIKKYNDDALKLLRKWGINTQELLGRVSKQYHDVLRILNPKGLRKAMRQEAEKRGLNYSSLSSSEETALRNDVAFNKWHDFIKPRLDQRLSLLGVDWSNDSEVRDALRESFNKIITPRPAATTAYSLANRLSRNERHLFYKNGDSWVDYQEKYGAGNVMDSILRDAKSTARNLAMMKHYGANPMQTVNRTINDMLNYHPEGHMPAVKAANVIRRNVKYLMGEYNADAPTKLQSVINGIKTGFTLTKMGLPIFSVWGDTANKWRFLTSELGETPVNKIINLVKTFTPSTENEKEFYRQLGVMTQHFTSAHRFSTENLGIDGWNSRAINLEMKLNWLKWWDGLMQKSNFAGIGNNMASNAHLPFDQLPPKVNTFLKKYNFNADEWDLWRKGQTKLADDNSYLMPDYVLDAPDEDFKKLQLNKDQLYNKILCMYHDSYRFTVPGFDLQDRSLMEAHTGHNASVKAAAGLLLQFKSYMAGYTRKVLKRDIDLSKTKLGAAGNIARSLIPVIGAAAMGQYAKSALLNRKPDHEEIWINAILGSMGMIGDGISALSGTANDLGSFIIGPSWGPLSTLQQYTKAVLGKNHDFGDGYREKRLAAITMGLLKSKNIPFLNTPIGQFLMSYGGAKAWMDFLQPGSYESQMSQLHSRYGVTPIVQ